MYDIHYSSVTEDKLLHFEAGLRQYGKSKKKALIASILFAKKIHSKELKSTEVAEMFYVSKGRYFETNKEYDNYIESYRKFKETHSSSDSDTKKKKNTLEQKSIPNDISNKKNIPKNETSNHYNQRKESIHGNSSSFNNSNESNISNGNDNLSYKTEDKISYYSYLNNNSDINKIEMIKIFEEEDRNRIENNSPKKEKDQSKSKSNESLSQNNIDTSQIGNQDKLLSKKRQRLKIITDDNEEESENEENSSNISLNSDEEENSESSSSDDQMIRRKKQKLKELVNSMFFLKINTPASSGLKTMLSKLTELSKLLNQLHKEKDLYIVR